jgi:hypothetical protein
MAEAMPFRLVASRYSAEISGIFAFAAGFPGRNGGGASLPADDMSLNPD